MAWPGALEAGVAARRVRGLLVAAGGPALSPWVRRRVASWGLTAAPALGAVAADPALWPETGAGWAALHAVRLLDDLGGDDGVRALFEVVARAGRGSAVGREAARALEARGPALLEPGLAALAAAAPVARLDLLGVLVAAGARAEPLFAALRAHLDVAPTRGAELLADYGDRRALPHLQRAFDAWSPEHDPASLGALKEAIERLGGALDRAQRAKLRGAGSA